MKNKYIKYRYFLLLYTVLVVNCMLLLVNSNKAFIGIFLSSIFSLLLFVLNFEREKVALIFQKKLKIPSQQRLLV